MFETTSDVSAKDHKSENIQAFSLPLIPNKPSSRGQLKNLKQNPKKQKIELPNIKQNQVPTFNIQKPTDSITPNQKQNKNTFARQVEQKLKMVLGGMQSNKADQQEQIAESYDTDDFDFQAQINKNKELIKQHKIKKQIKGGNNINGGYQKQKQKFNGNKIPKPLKNRNQSLYEKRAKQYKDHSIENKYLSKRKQTLKEKNAIRASSRENKNRNQMSIPMQNNNKEKVQVIRRSKSKANGNRILSHKSSAKNLQQVNKSVNLFDGIQNYLENPHQKRQQHKEQLIGLSLLKAKRDIQDKIKAINQQLGHPHENDSPNVQKRFITQCPTLENSDGLSKEWRRIQFSDNEVICKDSNFDKQLDRVSSLQQRNALSLQKYLQYQKMLLQIDVQRRSATYRKQVSSSQ